MYGEFETAPSVFSISGTVEIQTRLFETRGATLVYSLDTKAKNLDSREMALAEITPAIADACRRTGWSASPVSPRRGALAGCPLASR